MSETDIDSPAVDTSVDSEAVDAPNSEAGASGEAAAAEQSVAPTTDRSPLRKTVADILRSMGIITGIIVLVLIVTWRPQPDPVREIDAEPVATTVAAAAPFPVLFPQVGEGWRATSARYEPTRESGDDVVWFNGWVTPDDQYAAVVQSRSGNDRFIAEQTQAGQTPIDDKPTVTPEGGNWEALVSTDGTQRSFVRRSGGVTTVVTGTGQWQDVAAFADSLAPVAQ